MDDLERESITEEFIECAIQESIQDVNKATSSTRADG